MTVTSSEMTPDCLVCQLYLLYFLFQMPLWIPITYGLSVLFLSVVAIVTKPRDTATGLVLVLCTASPYYVLFVKKVIKSKTLDKYSCKYEEKIIIILTLLLFLFFLNFIICNMYLFYWSVTLGYHTWNKHLNSKPQPPL